MNIIDDNSKALLGSSEITSSVDFKNIIIKTTLKEREYKQKITI